MSGGLVARLRTPLSQRADFADVLAEGWQTASPAELASRRVYLENAGAVNVGDLFDLQGTADGTIRFIGDLSRADRVGAGIRSGEVVVEGSAGEEVGARMRRGVIAVTGDVGARAGLGTIAGSVVIFGTADAECGLWSKRGSIVAMGSTTVSPTYRYACTYQPPYLRLMLTRLRHRFALPVEARHLDGFYDRYSGDFAELGKGEILVWRQT